MEFINEVDPLFAAEALARWIMPIGLLAIIYFFTKKVGMATIDIKHSIDRLVEIQEQMLAEAQQTNKSVLKIATAEEENERRIAALRERIEEQKTFMEVFRRANDGGQ